MRQIGIGRSQLIDARAEGHLRSKWVGNRLYYSGREIIRYILLAVGGSPERRRLSRFAGRPKEPQASGSPDGVARTGSVVPASRSVLRGHRCGSSKGCGEVSVAEIRSPSQPGCRKCMDTDGVAGIFYLGAGNDRQADGSDRQIHPRIPRRAQHPRGVALRSSESLCLRLAAMAPVAGGAGNGPGDSPESLRNKRG